MDRPPRKTKVVNYSEAKDFDDDDDFVCVKAPPSKRAREDVKQEHSKSSNQESNSQSATSQKSRRPLERELEAAITLSLLNNGGGIKDQYSTSNDVTIQVPVDENTGPTSAHLSNCSVDLTVLGLNEITSEKESPSRSRQRKAASRAAEEQKNKPTDEDEEYEPKLTPDSESDEDFSESAESEDEEFTVKKVSKTKKKEKVTKNEKTKPPPSSKEEKQASKSKSQAAAASTPARSPPTAKLAPKKPASSSTVSSPTPVLPLSPAGGRIPKWNPPAQVGRSPTSSSPAVKSPGQGLRLGLSRLVRVKPLHPGVSSH
ncbi:RAD51-associated protein 1 [Lycodopsis pacificus]